MTGSILTTLLFSNVAPCQSYVNPQTNQLILKPHKKASLLLRLIGMFYTHTSTPRTARTDSFTLLLYLVPLFTDRSATVSLTYHLWCPSSSLSWHLSVLFYNYIDILCSFSDSSCCRGIMFQISWKFYFCSHQQIAPFAARPTYQNILSNQDFVSTPTTITPHIFLHTTFTVDIVFLTKCQPIIHE